MKFAIPFIFVAGSSWADCGGYEQTFLHCQIEDSTKTLSVCFDDATASYRFGPPMGPPELELTTPIARLAYTPWPGVGSAIWEEVTFVNNGHSYTVVAGLLREFPDNDTEEIKATQFGGVHVQRGDTVVAELSCDRDQLTYDWVGGLSEAKNNLGFTWNNFDREWIALPD